MSSNSTLFAISFWTKLQGVILDGGYELKEALDLSENEATFKVRVLGGAGMQATATFLRAEGAEADEQVMIWQMLCELPHPNLSVPIAFGRRRLDGVESIYVVMNIPDEKLADIVGERALSEEEAAEVFQNVARGLDHLHGWGMAHGCVSPETVWAIGNSILLASPCVRRLSTRPAVEMTTARYLAPESERFNATAAADVWCLGATLFEVLSQKRYDTAERENLSRLPLNALLSRCLDENPQTRCKLDEAAAILKNGPQPAQPKPAEAPLENKKVAGRATPDGAGEGREARSERPAAVAAPVPRAERHRPLQSWRQPIGATIRVEKTVADATAERLALMKREGFGLMRGTPQDPNQVKSKTKIVAVVTGLAGAAAVLAVFALLWFVVIHKARTTTVAATPAAAAPNAWPTKTLPGADATGTAALPKPADAHSNDAWRVVLYAYAHESDAKRRLELLTKKHRSLDVREFAAGSKGPYLIVMGGPMSLDEAMSLRKKAVELGLPRASFVKRF